MRRLMLFIAMLTMMLTGLAQSTEMSVCGIKMGTGKEEAKAILRERFGYSAVSEKEGNLEVTEGSAGGISHKFMTFIFAWIDGKSKFNGASFSTPYELSDQKDAIARMELIKSVYEKKYDIIQNKNDDGFNEYIFLKNPDCFGVIHVIKSRGKDGKTRLYCDVNYFGPYKTTDDI